MLKTLRRIIQEVNNAVDLTAALNIVVQEVCNITHAETCSVFLVDTEKSEYLLAATEGLNQELVAKLRLKFGEGLVGLTGEREQPINVANSVAHPKYSYYEDANEEPYHGFLGVPIIHQKELLGVLIAEKKETTIFNVSEESFLLTLVLQLSEIIAKTQTNTITSRSTKAKKGLLFSGASCVLGVAIGTITVVYPIADLDAIPDKATDDPKAQIQDFRAALKATQKNINSLSKSLSKQIAEEERVLFDAYAQILASPSLKQDVITEIKAGNWAPGALRRVIKNRVAQFEAMDDDYLRERALDLMDLGRRILSYLQAEEQQHPNYHKKTILIGNEITPANIAEVPKGQLKGIVSTKGSQNSHTAILARALGIPTIMGTDNLPLTQLENKSAIIDGYYGQLYISPSKNIRQEFTVLAEQEKQLNLELTKLANLPAQTTDGHRIDLMINTGLAIDIQDAAQIGSQGIGLYRTEMPFMTRDYFPAEEEQKGIYQNLLETFSPLPVTMRTLDVGGDKALSYLPISEHNPYLGWRGIRLTLDHPELFLIQVRAMLKANLKYNNLQIMLPMITSVMEIEKASLLITQAYNELKEEYPDLTKPKIGAMIEVPSAIYQTQSIARHVDFISVGSNDLTQYLLAVDRNNARVAYLYDSLHPAVLKALQHIVISAHKENIKASICGEMAGDPVAVLLLLAMGFNSLSMNANQLLRVKWVIRQFSFKKANELLTEVMQMDDATEIRYHMEAALEEAGMAGLIRAGNQ